MYAELSRLAESPDLGVLLNAQGDRLYTFRILRSPVVITLACVYTVREDLDAIYVGRITPWEEDED